MNRRLLRVIRRSAVNLPKEESPYQLSKDRDIFDYAGHKYSYEKEKNYGKWSPEELWGHKYGIVDTVQVRKEKIRDNWVCLVLFSLTFLYAYVSSSPSKRMLKNLEEHNKKIIARSLNN